MFRHALCFVLAMVTLQFLWPQWFGFTYYDYYLSPYCNAIYNRITEYLPYLSVSTYTDLFHLVLLPKFMFNSIPVAQERLYTINELRRFNGIHEKQLYLSILGNVFDVTSGSMHYGSGQMYHSFVGKDGSRGFITGDFTEEGMTDEVLDLSLQDLRGLKDWSNMYFKKYIYKGKLIGKFYDDNGEPTSYNKQLLERMELAEDEENTEKILKAKYPVCNVEWDRTIGTTVWCSKQSGGIQRDWIGVPRKLYYPGEQSSRCACIRISSLQDDIKDIGYLEEYENCPKLSNKCVIQD